MGIIQSPSVLPGQVGVIGAIKYMVTTDSLGTITTAGYLNNLDLAVNPVLASDILGITYSYNVNTNSGSFGLFSVAISNGVITLAEQPSSGVNLPTIANHIATYTNTAGTLSEDPATAISGGNIQAGLSGTAGTLASFPGTASKGSFVIAAVANTGNTITTLSNNQMGQASVVGIPDPGNAAGQLLIGATATPFVSGNFPQNSGTAGLMVDSGVSVSSVSSAVTNVGNWTLLSVTLSQAAIQGAYATPFQLVAAPGAGKVIVPIWATVYTNFQTAAFASGGVGIVQYGNTVHGAGTNALSATIPAAEITAAASQLYHLPGNSASALTAVTNLGLFFSNQTGAFTNGNAASTVVITLLYYTITATV